MSILDQFTGPELERKGGKKNGTEKISENEVSYINAENDRKI